MHAATCSLHATVYDAYKTTWADGTTCAIASAFLTVFSRHAQFNVFNVALTVYSGKENVENPIDDCFSFLWHLRLTLNLLFLEMPNAVI